MTPEEREVIEAAQGWAAAAVKMQYGASFELGKSLAAAVEALHASRARYRWKLGTGPAPWCVLVPDDEKRCAGDVFARCFSEEHARLVAEALNRP